MKLRLSAVLVVLAMLMGLAAWFTEACLQHHLLT